MILLLKNVAYWAPKPNSSTTMCPFPILSSADKLLLHSTIFFKPSLSISASNYQWQFHHINISWIRSPQVNCVFCKIVTPLCVLRYILLSQSHPRFTRSPLHCRSPPPRSAPFAGTAQHYFPSCNSFHQTQQWAPLAQSEWTHYHIHLCLCSNTPFFFLILQFNSIFPMIDLLNKLIWIWW